MFFKIAMFSYIPIFVYFHHMEWLGVLADADRPRPLLLLGLSLDTAVLSVFAGCVVAVVATLVHHVLYFGYGSRESGGNAAEFLSSRALLVLGFPGSWFTRSIGDGDGLRLSDSVHEQHVVRTLPYAWILWSVVMYFPSILVFVPPFSRMYPGASPPSDVENWFILSVLIYTIIPISYVMFAGFPFLGAVVVDPRRVVVSGYGGTRMYRPGKDVLVVGPVWGKSHWVRVMLWSRRFGAFAVRVRTDDAGHLRRLWRYCDGHVREHAVTHPEDAPPAARHRQDPDRA